MFHKVKDVRPLYDYRLELTFEDGNVRIYDVRPLFEIWPAFRSLRTMPGLFDLVKIEAGGYGVSWNADIDLSADELYANGKPSPAPDVLHVAERT